MDGSWWYGGPHSRSWSESFLLNELWQEPNRHGTSSIMSNDPAQGTQASAPAATGGAGSQFEGKLGAFYLLAMLAGSEPRGLPGASIRAIAFQQYGSGRPLDDVVIDAMNADGSAAVLEIQAKRSLTFTSSDEEFKDVVARMWQAAQKPEFQASRYELAVAIARTTTRIERACQEVLHWAGQLPDGVAFAAHIGREKFASNDMRDFVKVFRDNLAAAGAPTDDETVWRLLRRFQILVFDFESPGSDYEHRARERARLALAADQANRAADLWPVLIDHAGACARAGGARDRAAAITPLQTQHGFRFEQRADLRFTDAWLSDAADQALDEIKDDVAGVRLARTEQINNACTALETHRVLHIAGAPGVGKSSTMLRLARQLQPEGRIIVLRNGRIIPGGWLRFRQAIECPVMRDEFFNELGCGGGATLFIDNIDQIDDDDEWATVTDLLSAVSRNPGWRAVVTGGIGSDEWKLKLPASLRGPNLATLEVDAISDDETVVLAEGNQALGIILGHDHPARGMARNLFYLSRMVELGAGSAEVAAGIATEMDLARLWWRYGGGRAEDGGRLARLKSLRAMGAQILDRPGRVTFKTDDFQSEPVTELLQFDSLQEDIRGATVAFRHDVLRDWTIGFLLHEDEELLKGLPMDKPVPPGLVRGLEIAARLAIDSDPTGARWLALLGRVEGDDHHGSWKRPTLLALPRSEKALAAFEGLKFALLESQGRRLSEIIRLMIAVESVPVAKLIARAQSSIEVPPGTADLIVARGLGWLWLVVWLVAQAESLPTELIPDVSKVFQAWLFSTQHQSLPINETIVNILFGWLTRIDQEEMQPRTFRELRDMPPSLNIRHIQAVCDEIRVTAFSFAHLNPSAADRYLSGLDPGLVRHHEMQAILTAPGNLAKAAPRALADFALGALIEKEDDEDDLYRSNRYGPFDMADLMFRPASPGQGPFFDLLEHALAEGLRLVRGVVEHATQWWRNQYVEVRRSFPRISIRFPGGTKSFEGDSAVYSWARTAVPSVITTSALMALEAWGHRQIESGRPFEDVLHYVLGPGGSSIAFVSVAVDLVLSHWPQARDAAWPIVAAPEILELDDERYLRDLGGVDRMSSFEREVNHWPVKRADLDQRPSRRNYLSNMIGDYVFNAAPEQLEALRTSLEQARNEIWQQPGDGEDSIKGLHATAERAVRMTNPENWALAKITQQDGSEVAVLQFQPAPEEVRLRTEKGERADANMQRFNIRLKVRFALLEEGRSTPEIVAEGIAWAKDQPADAATSDGSARDEFDEEWNRRAVVMAAALAVRDYEAPDRGEVVAWALPVLVAATQNESKEYLGNNQIEYNMTAIGTVGLASLYLRNQDSATRDMLLKLASDRHPSVMNALGGRFADFAQIDPRLPRALIRIAMASSIHPNRADSERQNQANKQAYQATVEAAVAAEKRWLDGVSEEPGWPELPAWRTRPRRSFYIDRWNEMEEDADEEAPPDHYVDEHALGAILTHLIRFTIGELPPWIVPLAAHLMAWTVAANGPHGENDRDRDNRPHDWNYHFFDFMGILSVALRHDDVVTMFLEPIARFRDEPFHDVAAAFLRGFDRATLAIDAKKPENSAAVRELLAHRIRQGWNYRRLGREKGVTSESHAGDALTAMFYQPSRFIGQGRPTIPDNWKGLDATMPTLTSLVAGAPSSGYLAILFLNLVERSPRAALLPFVVQALAAWCSAYGADTNFWVEHGVGGRACTWLERTFAKDSGSMEALSGLVDDLLKSLDVLVRSGVAPAREIEERIAETVA